MIQCFHRKCLIFECSKIKRLKHYLLSKIFNLNQPLKHLDRTILFWISSNAIYDQFSGYTRMKLLHCKNFTSNKAYHFLYMQIYWGWFIFVNAVYNDFVLSKSTRHLQLQRYSSFAVLSKATKKTFNRYLKCLVYF